MALGTSVANDIANAVLDFYTKSAAFGQTTQDKHLLKRLKAGQKTFPSGKTYVSEPVKGDYMNSVSGFFAGYSEDSQLVFKQAQNILHAQVAWKEVHAGLIITWTELKKDGITVKDGSKTSEHSGVEITRLTGLLEDRMADYGESWSRAMNKMLWQDGTQDSSQVPGLRALLPDTYGTVAGLAQGTYAWWKHRLPAAVTPSGEASTLIELLRSEIIQLRRYGGRPNVALCGSTFLAGLRKEVQAKGLFTQSGFNKATDLGMGALSISDLGTFEYDPTMDDEGLAAKCYVYDSRHVRLRPMEGEDNKVLTPERPYDYMVFLKSMTWTGALETRMQNCNAIFTVN